VDSARTLLDRAIGEHAAGAVHIQRVIPDVPPLGTATAAMTVSALALAPFAGLTDLRTPDPATLGWLITLGVGATGGALVLFYTLIHRIGAVRANLVGYLAPAFAVAYGTALLGEQITIQAVAGLVVILTGSYITGAGPRRDPAGELNWVHATRVKSSRARWLVRPRSMGLPVQ
jgi:drug/metabolite transporter (DMT)-like permease